MFHVMLKVLALCCALLLGGEATAQVSEALQASVKVGKGGSGVVVRTGDISLILTAHHVIEGGNPRTVNGEPAELIAEDKENDLALLSVKMRLPSVSISEEKPNVGAEIVVIGCPFGHCGTITRGYITAPPDQDGDVVTSATVYPGNSGGAVLWYSPLHRKLMLVGIAKAVYVDGNFLGRTYVTSISYIRMNFRILNGYVKPPQLARDW